MKKINTTITEIHSYEIISSQTWCFKSHHVLSELKLHTALDIICLHALTHFPWCRIYASVNRVSIGSDNGLSPARRQAITWNNAGLLSIAPLRTSFSEIWIQILNFALKKMRQKMLSAKWRHLCRGDELNPWASCQIRKIAGCACAGNTGNVFPATDFKGNRK